MHKHREDAMLEKGFWTVLAVVGLGFKIKVVLSVYVGVCFCLQVER